MITDDFVRYQCLNALLSLIARNKSLTEADIAELFIIISGLLMSIDRKNRFEFEQ